MDLGLKDAKVLITGASRGLGFAAAKQFLREGAQVVISSRSQENLRDACSRLEAEGLNNCQFVVGDLLDPVVPAKIIEESIEKLGELDILLTNSGGPPSGRFEALSEEDWSKSIDLSLMCHVRLVRAALPALKQSPIAAVLTITSYSVKQPIPNLILSNSIRAATVGFTKSMALELGNEGIRFNSILPGWTKTERVQELMSFRAETNGTTTEDEIDKQAAESPLSRMAEPEEFAKPAVFLSSPAASYLTGVMLAVDGGMYKGLM